MNKIIRASFHFIALAHHLFVFKYSHKDIDFSKTTDPEVLQIKQFALRYFSTWNLVIQALYFSIALIYDFLTLLSNENLKQKILTYKSYVFTSLLFPSTLLVFTLFWSLYSINREWVLPEASDLVVPKWINHSFHTIIIIFMCIEVLICNQLLPSFKSAALGISGLVIIYNITFFFTYYESGCWLYGLYRVMNWEQRIFLTVLNYFVLIIGLKLGMGLETAKSNVLKNYIYKTL